MLTVMSILTFTSPTRRIGTLWDYHPQLDGTIRSRDLGDWINRVERQKAYEDDEFWTQAQDDERTPVLDQDITTYQQARQRPGRAASRDVSRRPRRQRAR